MKVKHTLLLLVMALISLQASASAMDDYLTITHTPTLSQPYAEFVFEVSNLHNADETWVTAPEIWIEEYRICNFDCLINFQEESNDTKTYTDKEWSANGYIVKLVERYPKDGDKQHPMARFRVWHYNNPFSQFMVRLSGKWGYNTGDDQYQKQTIHSSYESIKSDLDKLQSTSHELYVVGSSSAKMKLTYGAKSSLKRDITYTLSGKGTGGTATTTSNGIIDIPLYSNLAKWDIDCNVTETVHLDENAVWTFPSYTVKTVDFQRPTGVSCTGNQWKKRMTVTWGPSVQSYPSDAAYLGKWYIYRKLKDASTWTYLGAKSYDDCSYEDKDNNLEFETNYNYKVCFYPNYWLSEKGKGGIVNPSDGPFDNLNSSNDGCIVRKSPVEGCCTVTPGETSISVSWKHESIPPSGYNGVRPQFYLYRMSSKTKVWEKIDAKFSVTDENKLEESYEDKAVENGCVQYKYKVVFDRGDMTFESKESGGANISGVTTIKDLSVSKGQFKDQVVVYWKAQQVGTTATSYNVERTDANEEKWITVHAVDGTASEYSYIDNCEPGHYYNYRVSAYYMCDKEKISCDTKSAYGFTTAMGTISGQVTFDSGDAVENVRIALIPKGADGEAANPFYYSAHMNTNSDGIYIPFGTEDNDLKSSMLEKPFTVTMWVKPETDNLYLTTLSRNKTIEDDTAIFGLRQIDGKMMFCDMSNITESGEGAPTLNKDRWNFISMTFDLAKDSIHYSVIDSLGVIRSHSFQCDYTEQYDNAVKSMYIGRQAADYSSDYTGDGGSGFFDEVRVFDHALTELEIKRYYDRMLTGNEQGLALYWPLNEGVFTGQVYDWSRTNDVPNGKHGTISNGVAYSTDTPNGRGLLTCYGLTDVNGTYTIKGIPFTGNGTNYTVVPSKGIHEFSMPKHTRYISGESLVYSGVDFTDISSFPVHGTVRYSGTTIPVEDCTFAVDGVTCTNNGDIVKSAADGSYTISVPIGKHTISVSKTNHTFANEGYYPAKGQTWTFTDETYNLDFNDTTQVNFTGRIVGGFRDRDLPIGCAQSVNNIGKAQMELTLEDDRYMMNAKKVIDGTTFKYEMNTVDVPVASDTLTINSHSYRASGSLGACQKVYIVTDSLTGEFSATLPPVRFKMAAATLVNGKDATGSPIVVGESTLVDLTDFTKASADSVYTDSTKTAVASYYKYQSKYVADYHTAPIFKVLNTSFGAKEYTSNDEDGNSYTVDVYTLNNGIPTYNYGYPVFVTGNEYAFDLEAYEEYKNADKTDGGIDHQPLEGCYVQIANNLSASQSIITKAAEGNDDTKYEVGNVYQQKLNGVQLDKNGTATYEWVAGLPNTNAKTHYANSITMDLIVSGKYTSWVPTQNQNITWRADGTNTGAGLKGINVGAINMGNDFVTDAPDKVLMVLRDPPGAGSSTTWKSGSTITQKMDKYMAGGVHNKTIFTHAYGQEVKTITGTASAGVISATQATIVTGNSMGGGFELTEVGGNTWSTNYNVTTTEDISTSSSSEYVGSNGDVYIGCAKSMIFGQAREVYLKKDAYTVDVRDVTGMRDSLHTSFRYSQDYIVNNLIPKFKEQIKSQLEPVGTTVDIDKLTKPRYVSKLQETDPNYGTGNKDKSVWGDYKLTWNSPDSTICEGKSYIVYFPKKPSKTYIDTIQIASNNINNWKARIAENEKEKLDMYDDRNSNSEVMYENISFDGGAKITRTYTTSSAGSFGMKNTSDEEAYYVFKITNEINKYGTTSDFTLNAVAKQDYSKSTTNTYTNTFTYTLADNPNCTHSIDVYRAIKENDDDGLDTLATSKNGWGPIFRTRAGQTYGPYEDGDSTKYYMPGEEIMAKTIQMEVPQLIIDEPIQSNIPNGGTASFKVKLSNQSHSGSDMYFTLSYKTASNPNGAILKMDGAALNGVKLYIPYNTTIEKVITLTQSDKSILDYNDITIALTSTSQSSATSHWPVIQSCVKISAHFVPVSTNVNLLADKTVMNTESSSETVAFTLRDFDPKHQGLKYINLQQKYGNEADWTTIHSWVTGTPTSSTESSLTEAINANGGVIKFSYNMHGMSDGNYIFRSVSATKYGNDGEVTKESEIMKLTKDMEKPRLITLPQPANGVLDLTSEITAEFNKDIAGGKITKDGNMEVYGTLLQSDDVGYQASDLEEPALTKNRIDLRGKSFSAEFWIKNPSGTMCGIGDPDSPVFAMSLQGGKVVVEAPQMIPAFKKVSAMTLPNLGDGWAFCQLTYAAEEGTKDSCLLNLNIVSDAGEINIFHNVYVPTIQSRGKLFVGGKGCYSKFYNFALWRTARSWDVAKLQKSESKTGLESNLTNYWPMSEGSGTVANDVVQDNDLILSENSWFHRGTNYSAALTSSQYLTVPFGDSDMDDDDSYALEFWFAPAGGTDNTSQELCSDDNGGITISYNPGEQNLTVKTKSGNVVKEYTTEQKLTGEWHHVALNVQRGIAATLLVDGASRIMLNEKTTPVPCGAKLTFGKNFVGNIDEIRIWKGVISNQNIAATRFVKIDTTDVTGLVRYYKFEHTALDAGNQQVTTFSMHNNADPDAIKTHDITVVGDVVAAKTAAPMIESMTRSNLLYDFVASDRKVTINIDEDALSKLEGTNVIIVLKNVRDLNGNISNPFQWSAHVRRDPIRWSDETSLTVNAALGEKQTFTEQIVNKGGSYVPWKLNLPSWITASPSSGILAPTGTQEIMFTVSGNVSTGDYEGILGLLNINNNVTEKRDIALKVRGQEPDWTVDTENKPYRLPITAKLMKEGKYSEQESDMLAAFVGTECIGVCHLQYVNERDAYYASMTMYGDDNTNGKTVVFKAWDADENLVYTPLIRQEEGNIVFNTTGTPYGSYDNPEVFSLGETIEQTVNLKKGWNWVSFYVKPEVDYLSKASGVIEVLKTQTKSAVWNSTTDDSGNPMGYLGELTSLRENSMYAIKATKDLKFSINGTIPTETESQKTLNSGWTWIRNPFYSNQSVASAFSSFSPYDADVLQGPDAYAQWSARYNRWEGTMTNFLPGTGYKYYTEDQSGKVLFGISGSEAKGAEAKGAENLWSNHSVSSTSYGYADNMTVLAKLDLRDVAMLDEDTIRVFSVNGNKETFVTHYDRGYYVMTLAGPEKTNFSFNTLVNGVKRKLYPMMSEDDGTQGITEVTYQANAIIGTFASPLVLTDNPDAAAIRTVSLADIDENDSYDVYDLKGIHVLGGKNNGYRVKTLPAGIYIIFSNSANGQGKRGCKIAIRHCDE